MKKNRFIVGSLSVLVAAAVFSTAAAVPVKADWDDDYENGYDFDYDGDEDIDDIMAALVIADAINEANEAERKEKARKQAEETERQRKEAERQREEAEKAKREAEQAKAAAKSAQEQAAAAKAQQDAAKAQAQAAAQAAYYQQLIALQNSHRIAAGSITVLPNGALFDANFYAAAYPDVVRSVGRDPKKLYNHYITYGIKEGRLPSNPLTVAYLSGKK